MFRRRHEHYRHSEQRKQPIYQTYERGDIMELNYIPVGDYLLPAIKLSNPPDASPLGLYGELHKRYLREHRPILYNRLLLSEKLYPICREIDEAVAHRLRTITNREQAHEIILAELVCD